MTAVTSGGAIAEPRPIAAMTEPFARPRAAKGMWNETACAAAGNVGASPTPSRRRAPRRTGSAAAAGASAIAAVAATQVSAAIPSTRRAPSRSARTPAGTWHSA